MRERLHERSEHAEQIELNAKPSDRRGLSTMQNALQSFLRETGIGERMRPSAVYRAWTAAAGDALARHARPVRFRRGELCVEVDSAPHHHELKNFMGEKLRAAANARLGREEISRVVFRLKR